VGGIAVLAVMAGGLVMMGQFGMGNGVLAPFMVMWVVIGLVGAGVSFYNAFSRRGVALYEIETDGQEAGAYCPQCGKPIGQNDRFCRHCGAMLS
jgi:hypothetical protein